jgi:hypothetical protein
MHVEPVGLMIFSGVTGLVLLILSSIKAKKQQRLRNLILKRLD